VCLAIRNWQEDKRIEEDDPKREEKLERRRQKMRGQPEEAKNQIWNIRDEKRFEDKSRWIIDRTLKKIEQEIETDYVKSLYEAQRRRPEMNQDQKLQLAKQLIDTVRDEEHHIMLPVDIHVQRLVDELDDV
jgi:hypothetical protein